MEVAKRLRDIDKEKAIESYNELIELKTDDYPGFSRVGLKALDYFFLHHRIKAKTKSHISFFEILKDKERMGHLNEIVVKYKKKPLSAYKDEDELLKAQYSTFQLYYGTINQFRPAVAKWVYTKLNAKVGILDFSAGWGGRCLAAMSLGIPYTGCDANKNLESSYKKMIQTYQPDAKVKMFFQPSETVDFSKFNYDLVFTSPPYFMIEEYERMPAYKSKQGFLDKFFIPVTLSAWENLKKGGHMALNMPEEMYDAVKDLLPKIKTKFIMPLSNRHPSNAAKRRTLGSKNTESSEYIYVWHKK